MKRILHLVSVKNITFKSSYNWFKIDIHQQLRPLTANYLAMFKITSTTIYIRYKAQNKCKTPFYSHYLHIFHTYHTELHHRRRGPIPDMRFHKHRHSKRFAKHLQSSSRLSHSWTGWCWPASESENHPQGQAFNIPGDFDIWSLTFDLEVQMKQLTIIRCRIRNLVNKVSITGFSAFSLFGFLK